MARLHYLFTDLLTGAVLDELPLTGVEMNNKLNGWGILRGSFPLNVSGKSSLDMTGASIPGKCGLIVQADGQPIWDGIIWARWYQAQANSAQFTARTIESYFDKVNIKHVVDYVSYEQRNIVRELITDLQVVAESNLRINVPSAFGNAVLRTLNVLPSEYKTYYQVISAMADGANGFDWTVSTSKVGAEYTRVLRIGYPTLGATTDGNTFEYPGNITNYYASESIENAGTHMTVLGAGEGEAMITGTYTATDLIGSNWPRLDVTYSRKDIENQNTINDYAMQIGVQRRPPFLVIKAFVKDDQEPIFGSYGLGDLATLAIKDARYPEGIQIQARMVAFSYRPSSDDSVGEAELIFEGDELNGQ